MQNRRRALRPWVRSPGEELRVRNLPASFVAWRCASLKYAGTVMTARPTGSPKNASANSSLTQMNAEISGGVKTLSPAAHESHYWLDGSSRTERAAVRPGRLLRRGPSGVDRVDGAFGLVSRRRRAASRRYISIRIETDDGWTKR